MASILRVGSCEVLDYQEWLPVSITLYDDRIDLQPAERKGSSDTNSGRSRNNKSQSVLIDKGNAEQPTDVLSKVGT